MTGTIALRRQLVPGDAVILPKGKTIGMGRLKSATPAVVDAVLENNLKEPFYRVRYRDAKGRERFTYYDPTRDRG